jgi:N-acetylmuramidase
MIEIWQGAAKRLDDIDLPNIGKFIAVGEDEVHAILDVESAGSGFDLRGRVKILFEPHVFYRELGTGPKRDKAIAQGLAYPKWKRDYPADSYPRLIAAIKIDRNAALRSASWGLPQMMGFNCRLCGYPDAESMVKAFAADEENQLKAMIEFIKSAGLDDELRRHDWKGFARGYNGSGFAQNRYDVKLEQRYMHWQRIKDTVVPPPPKPVAAPTPPPTPIVSPVAVNTNKTDIAMTPALPWWKRLFSKKPA